MSELLYYLDKDAGGDTAAPVVTITSGPSSSKISRVTGKDATSITFQADEAWVQYQVRVVSSSSATVAQGTQLEIGTVSIGANTGYGISITDDELVAAGAAEGNNIVKIFVKDAAGNWSA